MEEAVSNELFQRLLAVVIAACFGLLVSRIAWRNGFYVLPPEEIIERNIPSGKDVLKAFALFLGIEMLLAPVLYALIIFMKLGTFENPKNIEMGNEFQGWLNLVIIAITAIFLTLFFASRDKITRDVVWGSPSSLKSLSQKITDFFAGSITWIIAYPWVIVISQILAIFLAFIYTGPHPDQAAVKHLKGLLEHPALFSLTAIAVVSVIPYIEELLFRGFLQTWLKTTFGRTASILLTSLIFASFHFSTSQGIENIEFISSLFLLSCYLGFIKERQQSLWASIGLHSTFNFLSVLLLLSQ